MTTSTPLVFSFLFYKPIGWTSCSFSIFFSGGWPRGRGRGARDPEPRAESVGLWGQNRFFKNRKNLSKNPKRTKTHEEKRTKLGGGKGRWTLRGRRTSWNEKATWENETPFSLEKISHRFLLMPSISSGEDKTKIMESKSSFDWVTFSNSMNKTYRSSWLEPGEKRCWCIGFVVVFGAGRGSGKTLAAVIESKPLDDLNRTAHQCNSTRLSRLLMPGTLGD